MHSIVHYPHPSLRRVAQPITSISKELEIQVGEMLELMYKNEGVGLAANQINENNRVIVMNSTGDPTKPEFECVAINPSILEQKGWTEGQEGCLSLPGLYYNIRRAKKVKVQAYNLRGELFEMVVTDLEARVWQHEIDHLDGKLFIDKMGTLGRKNCQNEIDELIAEYYEKQKDGLIDPHLQPIL